MSELTLEEQEKILLIADGLIREPESWIKSRWRCPLLTKDEDGRYVPKCDVNGQELYSYCIQGAVNQAAIDVLGEDRAKSMGIGGHDRDADPEERVNQALRGGAVAAALDLDRVAFALYAEEEGWDSDALEDHEPGDFIMNFNDGPGSHEKIRQVLRTRLARVRAALGKEQK